MAYDAKRVAAMNDRLRMTGQGGQIVMTQAFNDQPLTWITDAIHALRTFIDFNPDNDPHKEHDCAVLEVGGKSIMFKIDVFEDDTCTAGAEDPSLDSTYRVCTFMMSSDY